jgi:hypothetical protein
VVHFFSFTGRKEMNKSTIATVLNRNARVGWLHKNLFSRLLPATNYSPTYIRYDIPSSNIFH